MVKLSLKKTSIRNSLEACHKNRLHIIVWRNKLKIGDNCVLDDPSFNLKAMNQRSRVNIAHGVNTASTQDADGSTTAENLRHPGIKTVGTRSLPEGLCQLRKYFICLGLRDGFGYDGIDQAKIEEEEVVIIEKPTIETNETKTARKESGALVIEDWVSDSDEENVSKINLTDYEEINGGFVAFGGNSKGGKITGKGSGPNWLFDIDALTKSMNYKPVVAGNQSNGSAGTKACDDAGKARMETVPGEEEKQDAKDLRNEDCEVPSTEETRVNQEKDASVNSTNTINTVSTTVNTVGLKDNVRLGHINLDTHIPGLSIYYNYRIHKDHLVEQIIGDIYLAPQTRRMTNSVTEQAMFSSVQQRTNHKDFLELSICMFLITKRSQEGNSSIKRSKLDRSYVRGAFAVQVTTSLDLEEGIDYDEVFGLVARIESIRLFLAYASFKDFVMYQMDVKSAFLYGKIEEEVYVCQPPGFEDPNFPDRVYKVEKDLYGLHQAPKACDVQTASTPMETHKPLLKDADGEDIDEHIFQVNPKVSHLHAVKRIFRYLKGQPKFGLWYPKDSPFDLVAYTDSDYAGASLDRKSTT
ncbi:ribonuclease H-like domain-containing protein [Tanacetum coccineum]